ncbi:G2/M phase-specific E3 ubiquitin-protein ligase-like isoform X2 [Branchiostoma floridae x Branchiostoma belcheri]
MNTASDNGVGSILHDVHLFLFLIQLDKATNETLSSILETEEGSDMLEQAGWTKPTRRTTMEMIPLLRRALCYQDIIMKRKPAIDQLKEGLATLGLLDTIQRDPLLFGALLRYTPEEHRLTADSLWAEFKADYSEEGSSRKHRQMAIVEKLSICLTDIEDEDDGPVSLKDFLCFVTSHDAPPPVGWTMRPAIRFRDCKREGCRCLPTANVCSCSITFPEHMFLLSNDDFLDTLKRTVSDGYGFGQA